MSDIPKESKTEVKKDSGPDGMNAGVDYGDNMVLLEKLPGSDPTKGVQSTPLDLSVPRTAPTSSYFDPDEVNMVEEAGGIKLDEVMKYLEENHAYYYEEDKTVINEGSEFSEEELSDTDDLNKRIENVLKSAEK